MLLHHNPLLYALIIFNFISMVHLGLFIVGADLYDIKQQHAKRRRQPSGKQPLVSVVVPAHDESVVIKRTLDSILKSSYQNLEVIVVDDGSKDDTPDILRRYISGLAAAPARAHVGRTRSFTRRGMRTNTKLAASVAAYEFTRYFSRTPVSVRVAKVSQLNAGKAAAMNNAIKTHVRGELVMCLDADAVLHPQAVARAVRYFDDPSVIGVAANVRLIDSGTWLSKLQRFEHLIGYRSKKFYSVTNSEFIIGGVASTYRTDLVRAVGMYDSDTATEDIGLSLKMIARYGNRDKHIVYAADVIAATETVETFRGLLKQRYRWKIGCLQNLFKYRRLIGGGETGKHGWLLTKYRLPMALIGELRLILDPLLLGYIVYLSIYYRTFGILLGAYLIITVYVLWNVWPDEHLTISEKLRMSSTACIMYGLFYVMDVVQVAAIYHCLRNYRDITERHLDTPWISPERAGMNIVFSR